LTRSVRLTTRGRDRKGGFFGNGGGDQRIEGALGAGVEKGEGENEVKDLGLKYN